MVRYLRRHLGAQPLSETPRYSVVVPVFHEAENIGPFCRAVRASFPPGYELLICYDMADDRTLPALARRIRSRSVFEGRNPNIRAPSSTSRRS